MHLAAGELLEESDCGWGSHDTKSRVVGIMYQPARIPIKDHSVTCLRIARTRTGDDVELRESTGVHRLQVVYEVEFNAEQSKPLIQSFVAIRTAPHLVELRHHPKRELHQGSYTSVNAITVAVGVFTVQNCLRSGFHLDLLEG
jgi:hypothetical protein